MKKKSTGLTLLLIIFLGLAHLSSGYSHSSDSLRRVKPASEGIVFNGAWLNNMRELLGLYPDELAGLLGDDIATSYINLLEQSEEELPQEVVQKINEEIYPKYAPRVIREALDKSGLTHKQLAEYMGVNVSFIGNMIRGYYKVPIKRLEQARQLINSRLQEEITGDVIFEMRSFLELSQTDFGALINCSQEVISLIETGKLDISDERKALIKEIIDPLLSARLVEIREVLDLSQRELADELGVSEASLVLLEEGKGVIFSKVLKAVRESIWPVYAPQRLSRIQEALGMIGESFAIELGYSDKSTLIRMEEGKVSITLETLKLANEFYDRQAPSELKKIREMLHFSTEELALGLSISSQDIEEMEEANRPVPLDALERIRDEVYPMRAREVYIAIRSILGLSSNDIADYLGCSSFHASNMASVSGVRVTAETLLKMNELYERSSPWILEDMREGLGLSKEELGQQLGTAAEEIEQMERGEREISLLLFKQIEEEIYNPRASQLLREMRTVFNMSQGAFGTAFGGYSQEAISRMELGKTEVPVMLLRQVRIIYNQFINQGAAELGEKQTEDVALLQKVADTLGIKRTELAERLGISLSYLNHLFCGSFPVSRPIRDKLNALLSEIDTETTSGQETGPADSGTPEEITVVIPEKTPGNILKDIEVALADLGVGPESLAAKLDITMPYLRMMEAGMTPVSGDKLEIARRFLELSRAAREMQDALASQETRESEVIPEGDSVADEEESDSGKVASAGEEPEANAETTAAETETEEPGPATQTQPAPARISISAQILKDIQKQLGLGIDEFAESLGTSSVILRLWISGMMPIPEEMIAIAQALLSPEDDPVHILADIQAKLRVNREVYATMLGISYTHLTNVLNYRSAVSAEVITRAQALLAEKEAENTLQRQPFYPDYIYWRWVLEEVMNILEVNLAGLANKMKIGEQSLSLIMTDGRPVSEEMLIKAQKLLNDEQFEILKKRVSRRITAFENKVRSKKP